MRPAMTAAPTLSRSCDELTIPSHLSFLAPSVIDGLMRVGKVNDGGYVVPTSSIKAADFLISLGVSDDWSFEENFKRLNPGVQIHAYDHTISKELFRASVIRGFMKMLLGKTSLDDVSRRYSLLASYKSFFAGPVKHFKMRVKNELSLRNDVTLEKAFQLAMSDKVFLKIDIEGAEYKIIDDLAKHADKVVGMAIEFHDTSSLRTEFVAAMKTLQEQFEVVHLHANNFGPIGLDDLPEALEITFVRKSQCSAHDKRLNLPVPVIDSPNNPRASDYQIRFAS